MILYEFYNYQDFKEACLKARDQKYIMEVYTPLPEEDLIHELGISVTKVSMAAYIGGLVGVLTGFFILYLPNAHWYPMNIGGKPMNSWPAFAVITFELGVLFSAFSAVGAFLFLNRYPRFDRSVFSSEAFNENRHKHFFLCLQKDLEHAKADHLHKLPDSP